MSADPTRRVLLVEDQRIVRVLLARTLRDAGFVVSDHADAAAALAAARAFDPDVVVTDIDLGSRPDGAELATILRRVAPALPIVFLTNYPPAAAPRATVMRDATVIAKNAVDSTEQLIAAVDASARHGAAESAAPPPGNALSTLSRAQLGVLALMVEGHSNEEIARRTGRSTRAVERLVARTFDRLGLSARPNTNPRVLAVTLYTSTFGHRHPDPS